MRVRVLAAATAAFIFSSTLAAADYTGFWKMDCRDPYGISIKPNVDKTYSLAYCATNGCNDKWRPNSGIDGDPLYRVIDAETLETKVAGGVSWQRWKKCTTETNPKLEWPEDRSYMAQRQAAQAQPTSGAPATLNPLWFGTWKSEDGTASLTISASKLAHTYQQKDSDGKLRSKTDEHSWSNAADGEPEAFGYRAERTSPDEISTRYEEAVRQFKEDPTDFVISDPAASRRAIAAISPGVYRILWSYWVGDCGGWDYILDKDRMLEISECKYGFEVVLYNRVTPR